MSHGLPNPPHEVPVDATVSGLAPGFLRRLEATLVKMRTFGHDPIIAETLRSDARQRYLYGFGRDYDDGRGRVTNSPTAAQTWHHFGVAADIISKSKGWDAPQSFWDDLGTFAEEQGLAWGGRWKTVKDKPHVQMGAPMIASPSHLTSQILAEDGIEALWKVVGALT